MLTKAKRSTQKVILQRLIKLRKWAVVWHLEVRKVNKASLKWSAIWKHVSISIIIKLRIRTKKLIELWQLIPHKFLISFIVAKKENKGNRNLKISQNLKNKRTIVKVFLLPKTLTEFTFSRVLKKTTLALGSINQKQKVGKVQQSHRKSMRMEIKEVRLLGRLHLRDPERIVHLSIRIEFKLFNPINQW